MNNIFDSHSHYTESAFDCDREELLNNLPFKGVEKIVTVSACMEDCPKILELTSKFDYIYGALGVRTILLRIFCLGLKSIYFLQKK